MSASSTLVAMSDRRFAESSECEYSVEYSASALERVRAAGVEGLLRFRHGGLEVGGLLLGRRDDDKLVILSSHPIECEHLHGPAFLLSTSDEEKLGALLDSITASELVVLGWYHTHTRSDIQLTDTERAFHARFFPEPWQTSLVLRPSDLGPTKGMFYFRNCAGPSLTLAPRLPFAVEPQDRPEPSYDGQGPALGPMPCAVVESGRSEHPETAPPKHAGSLSGGLVETTAYLPVSVEPPRLSASQSAPGLRSTLKRSVHPAWLALPILFLFCTLGWLVLRSTADPVNLQVREDKGLLHIAWDRNTAFMRNASGGRLTIQDSTDRTEIELDGVALRGGNITYQRRSGNVKVRLVVLSPKGEAIAASQFLGANVSAVINRPPSQSPAAPSAAPLPVAPVAAAAAPPSPPGRASRPAAGVAAVPPAKQPLTARAPSPTPSHPVAFLSLRPAPRRSAPAPVMLPQQAPAIGSQVAVPSMPGVTGPQTPPVPHTAPQAVAPSAPPPATYQGPRTGRLIWTGHLRKGGLLELDDGRAASGTLIGRLPAVPVRISAHPADLTGAGIVVYGPARPTEPPGPQNGWNRTAYRWNEKRVRDLVVLEPPAPSNRWNKIVLQCENRDAAIVVIDWEAIPQ